MMNILIPCKAKKFCTKCPGSQNKAKCFILYCFIFFHPPKGSELLHSLDDRGLVVLERAALARWLSLLALSGDSNTFSGPSPSRCSSPKKKSTLEFSRLELELIFSCRIQGSWFEWLECTSGSVVLECLSVSSSLLPPKEDALVPRQSWKQSNFKL